MELLTPPDHTPEEVAALLAAVAPVHEMYAHLPFSADPKKSLIDSRLKRLGFVVMGDVLDEVLPVLRFGSGDARIAAIAKFERNESQILKALETETHLALLESVEPRYQEFALQHCADLIREYNCTTPSEKMLCETAAGAMARHFSGLRKLKELRDENWTQANHRTIRPTRKYTGEYDDTWTLARDHTRNIEIESKEVDRSLRQYQSIVGQLAQMKSPVPDVHIKTAFVGQNQQFNAPRTL
jgi:hypothetical protein